MSTRLRGIALLVLFGMLGGLVLSQTGPISPAAAAGTLSLDQTLSYTATVSPTQSVPTGATLILSLNYSCGDDVCVDTQVTIPIPAGLNIGAIGLVGGASSNVIGNTITVTLPANLAAGSAGQLTVEVTVPGWSTPNGAEFTWTSSIAATASTTVVSNPVQITANAASVTSASLEKVSGGTINEPVAYRAVPCVAAAPASAPIAVAASSSVVVTLAPGATFESAANGGVYDIGAGTITWTLGQAESCITLAYVVSYPSPPNTAGQTKAQSLLWTGRFVGDASDSTLATASLDHDLDPPVAAMTFNKWSFSTQRAVDESITWFLSVNNDGNTTADELTIVDTIPKEVKVTAITTSIPSIGAVPGEVWVAGQDNVLVLAAVVPVNGNSVSVNPYAAWPSGNGPLDPSDTVKRIELKYFEIAPGNYGDRVTIAATVMATSAGGAPVNVDDIVTNSADFAFHIVSGALEESDSVTREHQFTIAPQITTITTRLIGGGTLAPGISAFDGYLGISAGPFALVDPVMTLLVPDMVTLTAWAPTSTAVLATPTHTEIPDWQGTGATLHRFTWAPGTELPLGVNYQIDLSYELIEDAWGTMRIRGYGSSASAPYFCESNWFEGDPDAQDKDGDGNLTEVLCNWSVDVSPAPTTSAVLTALIASTGDFETGTVDIEPGGAASYRQSLRNTGTLQLNALVVITTLPRAGDTRILTSVGRSPASVTFPVLLTGPAVAPSLDFPVSVWYSTVANACFPELNSSPGGCVPADWTTVLPADPTEVIAVKVDYGANVFDPFTTWSFDISVTTPTSGATEPEFAIRNTDPAQPAGDERAIGTAAFAALTAAFTTLTAESAPVTLLVPSIAGSATVAPVVVPVTSSGVGVDAQTATVFVPVGGAAYLLDGTDEVTSLFVPGEGMYFIDPTTGELRFEPLLGFSGTPSPAFYRVRNSFGQAATSTFLPTVAKPAPPTASELSSTAMPDTRVQTATAPVPPGGSATLVDSGGVARTIVTIPGEGSYSISPSTGLIEFTPLASFSGVPTPIRFRVTDAYGQTAEANFAPAFVAVSVIPEPPVEPGPEPPVGPGPELPGGTANTGVATSDLFAMVAAGMAALLLGAGFLAAARLSRIRLISSASGGPAQRSS